MSAPTLSQMVRRMKDASTDPLYPLLDEYLVKRIRHTERLDGIWVPLRPRPRPPGRISPSKIGGCMRAAVFRFLGVRGTTRVDPEQELIFEVGNWYHHMFQSMFRDMQLVLGPDKFRVLSIERNVTIPSLYVSGWLDAEIEIHGVPRVWDGKTIRDNGFQRVIREGSPLEAHNRQITAYEKATGIPRGSITYINKNNQNLKNFIFDFDRQTWVETQTWCETVITALDNGKLPAKDSGCQQGNFMYERCPYARICYGGHDRKKIRLQVYRKFRGLDHSWKRGNKIAKEAASE